MATEKVKVAVIAAILQLRASGGSVAFVKAFSSPSHHTIEVAGAKPLRPAPPPLPPSKWPMKFSDGTTMEVLALNDPNTDASVWWKPDGTPTPDPQFRARGNITMNYPAGRRIDLIVRLNGSTLTSKGVNVRSDVSGDDDTAILWSSGMGGRIAKVITVVNDQQPATNLSFGLAAGAWTGDLNLDCADGKRPPFGSTGAGITFRAITEDKGQTVVHYTGAPGAGKEDSRHVVVAGGKELAPISTWSNLIEDTDTFDTPRKNVTDASHLPAHGLMNGSRPRISPVQSGHNANRRRSQARSSPQPCHRRWRPSRKQRRGRCHVLQRTRLDFQGRPLQLSALYHASETFHIYRGLSPCEFR